MPKSAPSAVNADPLYERLRLVELMILKIPEVPRPVEKAAFKSYVDSSFADAIALVKIPECFAVPTMKLYDRMTYSSEHVT